MSLLPGVVFIQLEDSILQFKEKKTKNKQIYKKKNPKKIKKEVFKLSPYIYFPFETKFSRVQVFYHLLVLLYTLTLKSGFEIPGALLTKIVPTVSTMKLENSKDI